MFCVAGGELSRESNPCVTFHRPFALALYNTDPLLCAHAHGSGVAGQEHLYNWLYIDHLKLRRWGHGASRWQHDNLRAARGAWPLGAGG